jgi:hypothetical protein
LGTRGTGLVAVKLHDVLRQFADSIEAASEGEVGVVEVDLLVVLRLPMSELRHGLGGDNVWLEDLELPLGLVVLVLQVVEQHVHLCEVGSGDRLPCGAPRSEYFEDDSPRGPSRPQGTCSLHLAVPPHEGAISPACDTWRRRRRAS